jgi:glycosyltransferase involved in cell wall biosynthesis
VPMKVLHFYKTALPESMGGVEQVIDQIASGASKHGVNSDVLCLTKEKPYHPTQMEGYTLHRAKLNFEIASTGFSLSSFSRFSDLAKAADIVHYHFPWPFMDMVHFVTQIKKPTVLTYHSDVVRQKHLLKIYYPLRQRFLSSVDRIVATSPNYVASSSVLADFLPKVSVIPIGLDKTGYKEPSAAITSYWQDRIPPKFFLFVGVLRYYKGLHILLKAICGTNFPIVIVGSGPAERELKSQAEQLGLTDNVYFLGFLSDEDKTALLKLCYALVFPSHLRSEAFGITLLEGAMHGKPLISSEIGTGTTYINVVAETGLVVPPSDFLALREAMRYLWEHEDEAATMGRRAEERYWTHFTAAKMVNSYVDLYYGLLK